MAAALSLAAVDLGASSGRVMLGQVGADRLEIEEVSRFRNGAVRLPDGLYWDALGLYVSVLDGLRDVVRRTRDGVAGVAIDSWAVDYGLLDPSGALLRNPRHYRDPRVDRVVASVHERVDPRTLYGVTGVQFLPFNTLYQLAAETDLQAGARLLLVPDLLGYWLTGEQVAERTNASTTGLLDASTGGWAGDVIRSLGLPDGLLPDVVGPGHVVAPLSQGVREEIGVRREVLLTTVGSHDTASAVVGVPAEGSRFGYVSCGTWGLVGVELDAPVLTEESRQANFTNERGVDGTVRYLRNVMGLWLLSESLRTWSLRGARLDLGDLLVGAAALPPGGPLVDPNDPRFLPPGDMPDRIVTALREAGDVLAEPTPERVVRCILDSLAVAFAEAVADAERLSGHPVDVVHIVGGGSQNALLCQLVADASARPVVAGPVEATALGNLLVQARTHGAVEGDLATLRSRIRATTQLHRYEPRSAPSRLRRG